MTCHIALHRVLFKLVLLPPVLAKYLTMLWLRLLPALLVLVLMLLVPPVMLAKYDLMEWFPVLGFLMPPAIVVLPPL